MAVSQDTKTGLVTEHGKDGKDTGSTVVQIALFTERIKDLTEHMKVHKKDFSSRRGLLRCVSKRQSLLRYLAKKNPQSYADTCQKLGIRR